MEGVRQELVATDIAGNAELQGKSHDPPPKLEGHNVLESSLMCASMNINWPESSIHGYMDKSRTEEKDLGTCVISLAGSQPPCTSPSSMNDTGIVVEELTAKHCGVLNPVLASSKETERQVKWQHIYPSTSGSRRKALHSDSVSDDKDRILRRAGEQLAKMSSRLIDKRIISNRDTWLIDERIISNRDTPLRNSSTPNFSQLLVKKALKGKGVVSRDREAHIEFGGAVVGHIDENLVYARKVASDALVRSNANNDQLSLCRISRSAHENFQRGISLREWLKPGNRRRDKVESLMLFRQILELVDSAHSQGVALQDLRPSCFNLLPSNRIMYNGLSAKRESEAVADHDLVKKMPVEQDVGAYRALVAKHQKISEDMKSPGYQSHFTSSYGFRTESVDEIDFHQKIPPDSRYVERKPQDHSNYGSSCTTTRQQSVSLTSQLEEKWYRSPEQQNDVHSTFPSNIYSLGVLLFELLSWFESSEVHSAVMLDLRLRILPPNFLSENPKEAGFCLWLLHPEASARPTAREILQSELMYQSPELCSRSDTSISNCDDAESELMFHFLNLLREQKQKHASKLVEDIECLEEDIKEVEKRRFLRASTILPASRPYSLSNMNELKLMKNINQISSAYFSMRSKILLTSSAPRSDRDLLRNRDRWSASHEKIEESNMKEKSVDPLGGFCQDLCKFARYNKFEVRGSLKSGDLLSSTNVVCSLSFNRDEDYIAAAGVSKKIKVFEFDALLNDSMDIHYPIVEMSNKSKLSCVCWNNYIKNYLAATDYDGVVQMWDAGTGRGFSQYMEHQKRAWSVDFSLADPMVFASASDDCSVKLWSINERSSVGTIWNPANVCCVQFSASSSHFLAFGSADFKVYCYDLRNTRIPWCTLAGHEKTVSYVKFVDSETLVSASTDNTLKLWNLNKTSTTGLSTDACSMTFCGHTNEKNFVGLSVLDGYIACGSETNEVYCYYRSLPMPITSHKFGYADPISQNEIGDDSRQFVSSVCWSQKSNMVVAANSSGNMKLLQMV